MHHNRTVVRGLIAGASGDRLFHAPQRLPDRPGDPRLRSGRPHGGIVAAVDDHDPGRHIPDRRATIVAAFLVLAVVAMAVPIVMACLKFRSQRIELEQDES